MSPCYLSHLRPKQFHLLTILYNNRLLRSKKELGIKVQPLKIRLEKVF